jgi:hypothetical protein
MRKLNKLPQFEGIVPLIYKRSVFVDVFRLLNAHSQVINCLADVIEAQEKRIKMLEKLAERKEEK